MLCKKFLILYHIKEREDTICDIIKEAILREDSKCEVIIGQFAEDYKIAFTFRPDILISIPPRAEWTASILTLIKVAVNPIIVSMTIEGLHKLDEETIRLIIGYNQYCAELVDYYFFWGPKMASVLGKKLLAENKAKDVNQFKAFGYIMYEKEQIFKKFSNSSLNNLLKQKKCKFDKILTFVTGFQGAYESIEDLKIMDCFKNKKGILHEQEVEAAKIKIESSCRYQTKYISHIIKAAKEYPNILFVVKLHPVEVEELKEKEITPYAVLKDISNIFVVTETIPIAILLQYTDILFHYGSTTGLEAYLYQVPTIQLIADSRSYPNTNYGKAYYSSTKNIDIDSEQIVHQVITKNVQFEQIEDLEQFLKDYFNYNFETEYRPSIDLAKFICSNIDKQNINKKDPLVKETLSNRTSFDIRINLYKSLLKSLLLFRISSCKNYILILKKISTSKYMLFNDIILEVKEIFNVYK